jgi:hypothetical protein
MARPGLFNHPKFVRFVRLLEPHVAGMPVDAATVASGILEVGLWNSAYDSGDPYLGTAANVEACCRWKGEPGALTRMLLSVGGARAGFIERYTGPVITDTQEPCYQIHDLLENAPAYVSRRAAREQERKIAKKCEQCGEAFFSSSPDAKYHNHNCQMAAWRARKTQDVTAGDGKVTSPNVTAVTAGDGTTNTQHPTPNTQGTYDLLPSEEDRGQRDAKNPALAAPSPAKFAEAWNRLTTPPIPRCRDITSTRKKHIRVRLTERPLTEWEDVIRRIQASAFCRGDNDRGWRATLDWLAGSPDVAVKVLEGKYDDSPRRGPQVITGSLKTAGNQAGIGSWLKKQQGG